MRVAVVGGGWAGLAAAVDAVNAGHAVTVFEMAAQWGGRARSVEADGLVLDNGQHILIGAYTETLALMRQVGIDPGQQLVRRPLALVYPDGHGLRLEPGAAVPAFVRAVLGLRGWSWGERLALLGAAVCWRAGGFRCDAGWTVARLTAGLPQRVRDGLIDPLCVAALNTPAAQASAAVFLRVLRDALFGGPGAADLLLPRVPLGALLPEPAAAWLQGRGAALRLGTRVMAAHAVPAAVPAGVNREPPAMSTDAAPAAPFARGARAPGQQAPETSAPHRSPMAPGMRAGQARPAGWRVDGEAFDAVVLACSAVEAARIVASAAPAWAARAAAIAYEPIVTVYLRSDGSELPHPMMALLSDAVSPAQFAFDLGSLGGAPGVFAFVVSGARDWLSRGVDSVAQATLAQATSAFAASTWRQPPALLRAFAERRATFACTPGLDRPPMRIAPGLLACGDYVAGPYPATLEGAVRSGREAATALTS